jgi:hypothetical protein
MRRIRFIICPAFLAAWSLLWLAGGCGSTTQPEAVNQQNIEDEQKAAANSTKGI